MQKGFSLLELIFAIVVLAIIASFAIPKYLDTRNSAVVSTLKRDISTIITSVQSYHLQEGKIENIIDAVTLNSQNWNVDSQNTKKISDTKGCLSLEVTTVDNEKVLKLDRTNSTDSICTKLTSEGIVSQNYQLL